MTDGPIFAEDLAARWRVHPSTARRWLRQLERAHGGRVVARLGKRLYTTDHALARVGPGGEQADSLADRVAQLEERVARLTRDLSTLASEKGFYQDCENS